MATLEQLEVQVKATSKDAGAGIASLSKALTKLDTALSKSFNTSNSVAAMEKLNNSIKALEVSGAISKINSLKEALMQLKSVSKVQISINDISNRITAAEKKVTILTAKLKQLNGTKVKVPSASSVKPTPTAGTDTTNTMKAAESATDASTASMGRMATIANNLRSNLSALSDKMKSYTENTDDSTEESKSLTDVFSKLNMVKGIASSTFGTISSFINKSNEYVEDVNLFTASLGEYAGEAQKYAEKASDALGIDPGQFLRNEGTFNSIIEGFGVAGDKAYLMSKNLTQLGYDLSSFFNISQDDAFQKLQSGISGELEPLRRLGYDLSVARLQQEAMNLGINKSVSSMSQAEKSQLRYYAIMTQVTQVQGDMARTLNAPANQLRVLKAQVEMAARSLGDVFIPILNHILPYLIAFAKLVRMVASAIASLVGFKLPKVDYSGVTQASGAMKSLGNNTGTTNSNLGKTPKAANKATKALKKLKSATLGIDELNIISPDEKDTSTGGSGTGGVGSTGGVGGIDTGGMGGDLGIDLPEYDFLKGAVTGKSDDILKKMKKFFSDIGGIIAGVSSLIIGVMLVCMGVSIPLGMGLIVAGATMLATPIALKFGSLNGQLKSTLQDLLLIVSAGAAVIGALLLFLGDAKYKALGLGLVLTGVIGTVAAITFGSNGVGENLKATLVSIMTVVSAAMIAIGAMFLFFGPTPKAKAAGLGMLFAGMAGMITSMALSNGKGISDQLKGTIAVVTAVVSAALIAIGGYLLFGTGGNLALAGKGLAMIVAGMAGLFATYKLGNGGAILKVVKQIAVKVGKILTTLSPALLIMGFLLLGPVTPLGIGLIAAGITGIVAGLAMNWGTIVGILKEFVTQIKKRILTYGEFALGIILLFIPGMQANGIGLIKSAMANSKKLGFDPHGFFKKIDELVDGIKEKGKEVKEAISNFFKPSKSDDTKKAGKTAGENYRKGTKDGLGDGNSWWYKHVTKPMQEASKRTQVDAPKVNMKDNSGELWQKFKKGWNKKVSEPVKAKVALARDKWESVKAWVNKFSGASAEKKIELIKDKWESVKAWLDKHTGGKFSKGIHLFKAFGKGIQTVKDWLMGKSQSGGKVEKGVTPKKTKTWSKGGIGGWLKSKDNWGTTPLKEVGVKTNKDWKKGIADWLSQKKNFGGNVNKPVGLKKSDWKTVYAYVTSSKQWGKTPTKKISLGKHKWSSVSEWVKQYNKDTTKAKVVLHNNTSKWDSKYGGSFKNWVWGGKNVPHEIVVNVKYKTKGKVPKGVKSGKAANGGVFTSDSYETFANGGIIKHYAGGTPDTHGSMFIAGEAGAELVGHINGRTEVMNRFQLASVMEHSISAGMSNFTQFWQELARNVVTCANGIINSVLVSAESMNSHLALANETSYEMVNRLAQYQMNAESQDVARRNSNSEWKSDMAAFYTEYVAPTLTAIATDTKRQADKNEKTVVTLGNKTLLTEIKRQEKANGYKFTK